MSDEVKFIFKTLLKVPVIIMVSFVILNIFAFFFIYFKVLGISYVVMQTAVENNYLPTAELRTLCNYVYEFERIPMVTNSAIIVGTNNGKYQYVQAESDTTTLKSTYDYDGDGTTESDKSQNSEGAGGIFGSTKNYDRIPLGESRANTATQKRQYGTEVTVGAHCGYRLVWPLGYKETIKGVDATGSTQGEGNGVQGLEGTGTTTFKSDTKLSSDRKNKETFINFDICYTVPGLKYYPDLLSN